MGRKTSQYVVLGVLLVVLVVVLVYEFRQPSGVPAAPEVAAVPGPARGAAPRRAGPATLTVPDVKLAALGVSPAEPVPAERNPFRLKPPPPPPMPPPSAVRPVVPAENPDEPPPPPPITLRFIGLVNAGGGVGRIAVLASGSDVFYGREGDIIDGRYKIVSIGAESVVVSYADGRGSRRIPLSG